MDERLLLSADEVEDITGYQKPKRQLRALAQMGIRAKQNARGRVVVSRQHAERVLAGTDRQSSESAMPDFDWMDD